MKFFTLISLLIFCFAQILYAQSRADLEAERKKALDQISYVDKLLKTTAKERTESMNEVRIIGKKLAIREGMLAGMRKEISLLSDRIELNTLATGMMESDLVELKKDYARAVVNSYKTGKGNPELIYVLSAKDFNQGYKRLKYLQQVTKLRRQEAEVILELKSQIESSKAKLQDDFNRITDLKAREEQHRQLLVYDQEKRQKLVKSLSSKERQLQRELEEKKRNAKKIEAEIARLIAEERKKTKNMAETPEQKLIGDSFAENKGRLPWPVERGLITSRFGIQTNPVLKNVKDENIGIEITSSGKVAARSIFKGEVARVFSIQGENMSVMIKHGKYFSVYNNIVNVKVKPGEKVDTKQQIGDVYSDPSNSDNCVLRFMIYDSKFQDPEIWIVKN